MNKRRRERGIGKRNRKSREGEEEYIKGGEETEEEGNKNKE